MKLTCSILMSSINLFTKYFTYIKLSKNSSVKYYQENKGRLQKKLEKNIKVFLKKKNMKNDNMVLNDTKTYQKMKTKSLLSIEKNVIKRLIIIIRNYFF